MPGVRGFRFTTHMIVPHMEQLDPSDLLSSSRVVAEGSPDRRGRQARPVKSTVSQSAMSRLEGRLGERPAAAHHPSIPTSPGVRAPPCSTTHASFREARVEGGRGARRNRQSERAAAGVDTERLRQPAAPPTCSRRLRRAASRGDAGRDLSPRQVDLLDGELPTSRSRLGDLPDDAALAAHHL